MSPKIKDLDIKIIKMENEPNVTLFFNQFEGAPPKTIQLVSFYLAHFFNIKLNKNDFEYSENNKPYLKSRTLYFSSSNKNNLSLIALSSEDIGVDIEYLDNTKDIEKISKSFFQEDEFRYIFENVATEDEKYKKFYEIWTKKEAYMKLMDIPLTKIRTVTTLDKIINSFTYKNYVVSISMKKKLD